MYPHERSLVEKHADEPFAIVGVDSDPQPDRLKPMLERQGISWRSFWNGPDGPRGPIADAWGVEGWPTICILDAKGVIRYRTAGADPAEIERQVEKLLAELDTSVGAAK
jgi:hypothetical protein